MKGIFLDIETNGLDYIKNDAIEICVCIYDLHDMTCISEYYSVIRCQEERWNNNSDKQALKINGITFDEVKNAQTTNEVCDELLILFLMHEINKNNSVFICQNPSFDRCFFNKIISVETQQAIDLPYHWIDLASMYFMKNIACEELKALSLKSAIPCSKDAIANFYGLPIEEKPHRAKNGVKHLIECYNALVYDVTSK